MNARQPLDKLHRQAADYPPLDPAGQRISLAAWNYALNRTQTGKPGTGGCLYGGQTATFWAPLRDLLHLTNGPVGCGVYNQANRPQACDWPGVGSFSGLNLTTDFQERDIVFGGENKLARAIAEADRLFPLNRAMSLLSTCPVALIGDDIDGVARQQQGKLGKPVLPVHCAGFRRGDGIGETHATIAGTWRDWASPASVADRREVTLLCREMDGAWRDIVAMLESIGLRVTARWPAAGNLALTGRLGHAPLVISVNMEYWAQRLHQQFGQPWVEVDFLGPTATRDSLRAIAAHCDAEVGERVEQLIASQAPAAEALIESCRERLAGKLYFSFAPLLLRDLRVYADCGIRVGSALQGWPDRDGRWQMPDSVLRYLEMNAAQFETLLQRAAPDVVGGLGQDGAALRKRGYVIPDERSHLELSRAAIGFAGTPRLLRELLCLFDSPIRRFLPAFQENLA